MKKPVVADLHESGWQHVLKESADELVGLEIHGSFFAGTKISVSEPYPVIAETEDPPVGNSGSEDVGSEIPDATFGVSDRLRVNVPVSMPYLGRDHIE